MVEQAETRARRVRDRIAELQEEVAELDRLKLDCRTRAERRPINQRRHMLVGMLATIEGLKGLPGFATNTRDAREAERRR